MIDEVNKCSWRLAIARCLTLTLVAVAVALVPVVQMPSEALASESGCDADHVTSSQPVGTTPCPGVRPGALVRSDKGGCTLNFLFKDGAGNRYIGTAGHCTLDNHGETWWLPGSGPEARDVAGRRIGEFAYAVLGVDKDFALIRIDRGVKAKPKMCHFGGPIGINRDTTASPVTLHHYGNGIGIGHLHAVDQPVLPARTAVALGMPDRNQVAAQGMGIFGDSGSPVISADGRAVGVFVHFPGYAGPWIGSGGSVGVGTMGITRLGPQLKQAERFLHIDLTLQRADLE